MAEITLTELRRTLFTAVDSILETGEPVVINRKGRRLVLREEAVVEELSHAERFRRYMAQGPDENASDLSLEDIQSTLRDYWEWDGEPEIDGKP